MTVPQFATPFTPEQFAETTRKGQEVLAAAVQSWTENVSSFLGALPTQPGRTPDTSALVDHVFDFAEQQLASQRELTKTLLGAATPPATDTTTTTTGRKTTAK